MSTLEDLNPRLDALEKIAKDFLDVVSSQYLKDRLQLAVRDVDEAREWMKSNVAIATLAANSAQSKIHYVQAMIESRGPDLVTAGG